MQVTSNERERCGQYSENSVVAFGIAAPKPIPVKKRSTTKVFKSVAYADARVKPPKISIETLKTILRPKRSAVGPDTKAPIIMPPKAALMTGPSCERSIPQSCAKAGAIKPIAAGIFAFAVGQSLANPTLLAILVLCAGVAINGAQSAMPALSARFYPTQCRATGVAWMSGIGRFGAVFGAWIGAVLLGNDWSFTAILSLLLIPATAAAVAIFVKSLVAHTDAT